MKGSILGSFLTKENLPRTIIVCLSALAIFSPYLFTRYGDASWPNFTDTGEIGDTIGGLTAPVIGLLNAILLYLTLRRQDEENSRTMNEIKKQDKRYHNDKAERDIEKQVSLIRDRVNQVSLFLRKINNNQGSATRKKEIYEGITALHMYVMLIRESNPLADRYSVRATSGAKFIEDISTLMFHASTALTINKASNLPLPVKLINYSYIKSQIYWVEKIYRNALTFKESHPQEIYSRFYIDDIIELGSYVNFIATLAPNTTSDE